uniref:polynucleotide adenylyltransferase n=1 Tax=Meloidogyne javanica TaxID=6303 RepID=A0A915MYC4_MELJA
MIIGGSAFLETAGPDSDLDIIFIFPQKCLCPLPNILADCGKCQKNGNIRFCTKHDLFFGSNAQSFAFYLKNEIYNVETIEEFQFKGYSMSDTYINSIENARVPIISISISGVEIDIMAAPIPFDIISDNFDLTNIENEEIVNKNNKLLDKLIDGMVKQNNQFYNKSILVLTGKQIYSNVFGYLSGTILTIMAAKVNLLYNSGGLTFLLQQFFKFYSECGIDEHWTVWLVGINLENNGENINEQKEKELLLTINEYFWKINKENNWLNAIYVNQNNLKNMWVNLRDYLVY